MARASSSLRSSTCDSWFDGVSRLVGEAHALAGCSIASPRVSALCSELRCTTYSSGTSRFSSTVMLANGRGIWKLRAMPRRVRW